MRSWRATEALRPVDRSTDEDLGLPLESVTVVSIRPWGSERDRSSVARGAIWVFSKPSPSR